MATENVNSKDFTGIEIMHHVLLWCYNWTEEDFRKAFKDSPIGWDYNWKKLQMKIKNGHNPTEAILAVILNMDMPNQQMLFNYIFTEKAGEIESAREWQKIIDEHS